MSSVRCDTQLISTRISQIGDRATRGIAALMRDYGELIAWQARRNAPRDDGYLEAAIRIEEHRSGTHGRLQVTVLVDESARAAGNKTVGDYAWIMERYLQPYGREHGGIEYNAGPGTQAKGLDAGGAFFARAVEEYAAMLQARALEIVRRALA